MKNILHVFNGGYIPGCMMFSRLLATVFILLYSGMVAAQEVRNNDSAASLYRTNNIKINLTANLLYRPAYIVAYERALTAHQTLTLEIGYLQFPTLFRGVLSGVDFQRQYSHTGIKAGAEYRFYPRRENRYNAPHGLYIGPYFSYYNFSNSRQLTITDSGEVFDELKFKTRMDIYQLGAQVGYQFSMIKNRLTLDLCMFGPAAGLYNASLKLDGNIDPDIRSEYVQKLADFMTDNFPLFGDFLEARKVNRSGRIRAFAPGFRYVVYIGFRF